MSGIGSLFLSRKFYLTAMSIVGFAIMLATRQIDGKMFAELAGAAVMVLVGSIAHEDNGKGPGDPPTAKPPAEEKKP